MLRHVVVLYGYYLRKVFCCGIVKTNDILLSKITQQTISSSVLWYHARVTIQYGFN